MSKDSREHILEVSLMLFLQKSFKAVTMKEIVEGSGMSKGAFYHYFSSKEQVFEEVVKHFYQHIFVQDFSSYSYESLRAFCEDYLKDVARAFLSVKIIGKETKAVMDMNHYFLIFDAMTLLPSFRELHMAHELEELKSWKKIIRIARKTGEIKTSLSDEQVAKMFIYMGDGFGMHLILENNVNKGLKLQKDLRKLWGSLFDLLKA